MSLKRKDASNGVRLAADCPHLVSLGSGRLSTAVTIHKIPFGHFTIGTSEHCGVIVQGSGIHPVHCSIFRHDNDTVSILPEKAARVLIDGIEIDEETNLSQGSMITIGKSNYLRFNNPAEAEMIKSSMGSNERISMPQIDFTQDSSSSDNSSASSTEASSPERVLNNLIETSPQSADKDKQQNISNFIDKLNKFDNANIKNILSPKVFTTDSVVTVNAPAKDVLGLKYNNFSKNLNTNCEKNVKNTNNYVNVVPQNNKNNLKMNNHFVTKTEPPSALYDRYPKPGAYGSLKLYPVSTILINNSEPIFDQQDQEMMNKELEQAKLDEILNMCAEYEKQHQNQVNNPPKTPTLMQQNRIKTNGSLPREKKNAFADIGHQQQNQHQEQAKLGEIINMCAEYSGYENVSFGKAGRMELSLNNNGHEENNSNHSNNGYENVFPTKKYTPQSPRTRIKTCLMSPTKKAIENAKKQNEYDMLIQSFEEKLKAEIKILRESSENRVNANETQSNDGETVNKSLTELKNQRKEVLNEIRELKTTISDFQRQEEEILRELDMEKALVTAELCTENSTLMSLEKNLQTIQNKIHRMEAQRNSSRVMQETQQAKLRQTMDVKQSQIDSLQQIMIDETMNTSIQDELNATVNSLDNDKKNFEDLEFQYLEEEAEWMGHREELYNDLKTLTKHIDEIKGHIVGLKNQKVNNQQIACKDTKDLEQDILTAHQNLEKSREKLKAIDKEIALLMGHDANQDSEEEDDDDISPKGAKIMSQSLFGSQEILSTAKPPKLDLMSMSMNENMFFSNIEMPSKSSTPMKRIKKIDVSHDITQLIENGQDQLERADMEDSKRDSILLLKYNLSPPYDHTKQDEFNLSLNSDDFHMNLLDKRVPSQDDIDRISAVTTNSPITAPGNNFKVFESIKEIEKNRQRLLTLQGSHVIEHERQRMNELRKRGHDAAILQYSQLHNGNENGYEDYSDQKSSDNEAGRKVEREGVWNGENVVRRAETKTKIVSGTSTLPKPTTNKMSVATNSLQRFSNPELDTVDTQQIFNRPLTQNNTENKDVQHQKQYKSNNDIRPSSFRIQEIENIDDKRNSTISESGSSDIVKRSIPRHQRPLTRYLPIMSSDLDLRQHIESAGHQITLCPHVIVDSTSCRGYLHKLGATFRGWSRRWFVLDREKRALIYYADKNAKKSRGGAYFTTIDEVYLDHLNESKSGRPHCTFIVKTKKRSYHLQAASDATARIWIDAIITGALGNIDY